MSHSGNYMDGVPVKISEKYKPPPRIELPSNLVRNITTAEDRVNECSYDFSFETNVLRKLEELQTAKETIKAERRHRLQLLCDAKQKQLDLIAAAEAEEKLRQLNVSDVSYPSAEEISEISPEDTVSEHTQSQSSDIDCTEVELEQREPISSAGYYSYQQNNVTTTEQSDPSILKPILLTSNTKTVPTNLLDDPDPLTEILDNAKAYKMLQLRTYSNKNNVDKMTFSDFENDTSSPFDNMELKTINDIELLAQVLNTQQDRAVYESSNNVEYTSYLQDRVYSYAQPVYTNCHTASDLYALPTAYHDQNQMMSTANVVPYTAGPLYTTNGYYGSNIDQLSNNTHSPNVNNYVLPAYTPNTYSNTVSMYQNNYPTMDSNLYRLHTSTTYAENTKLPSHIPVSEPYLNTYLPHTQYLNYDSQSIVQPPAVPTMQAIIENTTNSIVSDASPSIPQSRSRSVPDIVRELDEEIRISRLKAQQRSQNSSPASHLPSTSRVVVKKPRRSNLTECLVNPYEKLSESSQQICDNISGMGFPIDRVARACVLFGENDKKIIEYLLVLGELSDLGFKESKISEALVKNEFNRDKALDELVA